MRKGSVTRSTGFQVFLYVLFTVAAFTACFGIIMGAILYSYGAYDASYEEYEIQALKPLFVEHLTTICDDEAFYPTLADMEAAFESESEKYNVRYAIFRRETGKPVSVDYTEELVWANCDQALLQNKRPGAIWSFHRPVEADEEGNALDTGLKKAVVFSPIGENEEYIIVDNSDMISETAQTAETVEIISETELSSDGKNEEEAIDQIGWYMAAIYTDDSFSKKDDFSFLHNSAKYWYDHQDYILWAACGGLLFSLLMFIWIMCNAGHRWNREEIVPGVLNSVYLDILTCFWLIIGGMGGSLLSALAVYLVEIPMTRMGFGPAVAGASVCCSLMLLWCVFYCRELAMRIKVGYWWRNTLCYQICRLIFKFIRFFFSGLYELFLALPEIFLVVLALLATSFIEFVILIVTDRSTILILWLLEKMVLVPLILYCAYAIQKLRKAAKNLADGNASYKVDLTFMFLQFRDHAKQLNRLGEGITKAVDEQLKSERLKTELITNVSHDLKTPLTSVINYADLLATVANEESSGDEQNINGDRREEKDAKIIEYSEVLLRQSKRLKKLLEDLVEASKASTGNIEVNPVPCELGVLLTQVVGEYTEKMEEKGLTLIVKQPEEEVRIMADGRHLWRIFDNLLNNIYKYASENSRVYLDMELMTKSVKITFRNMSKYELNISPSELTDRFVRGDASRHMEGSGLGLSIAKSLVELQKGRMDIITDGDLFKVVLLFNTIQE